MPYVMETIKTVIDRQVGCGMKIIKFHLMIHYAEDILRFGSMKNYDSSIGERHHVSLIKNQLSEQLNVEKKCLKCKQQNAIVKKLQYTKQHLNLIPSAKM